ncbi:MAG TPA: NADH-quinone oxidoreductase subunit C [Thermoplasmatales archaeon]|nr:NADH-quinone oxidoreductase subunit C [Thermoplasmatales archaeon]
MTSKVLSSEELAEQIKERFKGKIKEVKIEKRAVGVKKKERETLWIKADKDILKDFVKYLMEIEFPHLAIISGNDLGKTIELVYHFSIYYGRKLREVSINLSVEVSKENPVIPTICDLIPGALITEREKQEMLGVKIEGIPDGRRIFLSDDFPEGVYPWRRDETGPDKMVRDLYEVKEE